MRANRGTAYPLATTVSLVRRALLLCLLSGLLVTALVPVGLAASGGLEVLHPPRVQLGDAPLTPYPGSELDRITIMWQTRGAGAGDTFDVAYRRAGGDAWRAVGGVASTPLEIDARVIYAADIEALDWGTRYEYRVRQLRGGEEVEVWINAFETRLRPGDSRPFAFAAYGDSAWVGDTAPFEAVQSIVEASPAVFTLLLGDNAYEVGSFEEYDARFDPDRSPQSAALVTGHVEHAAFGNHDIATDGGRPAGDLFAAPVPVLEVDAPAAPPATEPPEHNYSFDYGMAHFVTFDSNSFTDPSRLSALLDWVVGDLTASDARWKVVFAHHPLGAAPDKVAELAANPHFPSAVVDALSRGGADLLLVGHSHTVSWTHPISGVTGDPASAGIAFVVDDDGRYRQGDGFVQVVSGAGGKSLRPGAYNDDYLAVGFTLDTVPPLEYGFVLVRVGAVALTVEYIAADDGGVLGRFSIVIPTPAFGAGRFAR